MGSAQGTPDAYECGTLCSNRTNNTAAAVRSLMKTGLLPLNGYYALPSATSAAKMPFAPLRRWHYLTQSESAASLQSDGSVAQTQRVRESGFGEVQIAQFDPALALVTDKLR